MNVSPIRDKAAPEDLRGLVGRTPELGALSACGQHARMAGGSLVVVSGSWGMGKSTLLAAAREEFQQAGMTALHAIGRDGTDAFGTARELLGPLGAPAVGELDQFAAMSALSEPVVTRLASQPVALLLDDAPACDPATLRWLDFLLRRSARLPLLVVFAQRPAARGVGAALVAELAADRPGAMVELRSLAEPDVAEFVRKTMGESPDPSFVDWCARISGGNPKMLRALVDGLRASGVRPDAAGVRPAVGIGRVVLASWAHGYLAGQPEHVRRVAVAVAVLDIGGLEAAEPKSVSALCGMSESLVAPALEILRRDGVLTAQGVGPYDKVRRAVLADLPAELLDGLRLGAATVLDDAGESPDAVARLLIDLPELTEPWMRRTLREAAISAAANGAVVTAKAYLTRLIELAPDDVDLRRRLAEVLAEREPDAALAQLTTAIQGTASVVERAELACRLGLLALTARPANLAFSVLDTVLAELDEHLAGRPDDDGADLRTRLRSALFTVGLTEEATTAAVLARARTQPIPDGDSLLARAMIGPSVYVAMLAGRDAAAVAERAHRGLVRGAPQYHRSAVAAATVLHYAGESEQALQALGWVLASERDRADPVRRVALAARATVLERTGELAAAAADARAALVDPEPDAIVQEVAAPAVRLASVLLKRRQPERAVALLGPPRRWCFGWMFPMASLVRAEIRRQCGDLDAALAILRDCGRRLRRCGVRNPVLVPWWLEAACLLVELGRRSEALPLAEYGEETARDWATEESRGLALLTRGVATAGPAGLELLDAAVHTLARSPARLNHARAEYLFGRALLEADDAKSARTHLHGAVDLAVSCDYLELGAAARTQLVLAGGRMRAMHGQRLDVLSGTERRVAELAAAGATNRQIAQTLFVTVRTVETHLSSVYRKLRVRLRSELPAALRAGSVGGRPLE